MALALALLGAAGWGLGWPTTVAEAQSASIGASEGIGEVRLFGEEELTIQAATKTETPISKAPGPVTVVTARQIRESGARTIPEALRLVAGVNVRWNPMVQTLDMRSFGQNPFTSRVLLLIDGVPYNSWNKGGFPQHPGFDFFNLQNIKRLEVLRGPGSALYGENAYWGVVNIVTLSGEDFEGGRVQLFGGDLESRSLGVTYGRKVGENASYLISGRFSNGQMPMAFWRENDSEVSSEDFFFKGKYKDFELSYYRYSDEVDSFSEDLGALIPGARFAGADTIEQDVDIFALKYNRKFASDKFSFSGDVSLAQRNGSHCGSCHAAPQSEAFQSSADHGSQWIGDFRFGVHSLPHHELLFGVEVRRIDAGDHSEELLNNNPIGDPAHGDEVVLAYSKAAAYVQDQISLLRDKVQLILGARYDGSNDLFGAEVSPRVALVWEVDEEVVLRAGWGQAFRFPNFSELYQNTWFFNVEVGGVGIPLSVFVPNPDLTPESIETFDLGAQYRFHPNISAKLDLFYSEVEDFMVVVGIQPPPGQGVGILQIRNHPDGARIWGSEFELRWNVGQRINGTFNWSRQDQRQDGDLLDISGRPMEFVYAPKNKLNLATYFGPYAGLSGSFEVMWRDEVLSPSFWNEIRTGINAPVVLDSRTLVNLRLNYEIPGRWRPNGRPARISLYGKNLLDEEDPETLIGLPSELAGRTFYGGFEFYF